MKVFINPGHAPQGIPDPGAIHPTKGYKEALIVAEGAALLGEYLEDLSYEVCLLQSDSLEEICSASNTWGADLFISLHCNACNGKARGTEILYVSPMGKEISDAISVYFTSLGLTTFRGVKFRTDLYVLNHTQAPAILVELAFIDNDEDLKLLLTELPKFVRAILQGIVMISPRIEAMSLG